MHPVCVRAPSCAEPLPSNTEYLCCNCGSPFYPVGCNRPVHREASQAGGGSWRQCDVPAAWDLEYSVCCVNDAHVCMHHMVQEHDAALFSLQHESAFHAARLRLLVPQDHPQHHPSCLRHPLPQPAASMSLQRCTTCALDNIAACSHCSAPGRASSPPPLPLPQHFSVSKHGWSHV